MSLATYRASLRSPVYGVWSGVFSPTQGVMAFRTAIERGIWDAWRAGGKECGVKQDEFTQSEKAARNQFVLDQFAYIAEFIAWVEQNSKANGGKRRTVYARLEMWATRWNEAKDKASALICPNVKKTWGLGATEKHCKSCLKFDGRVYRASVWEKNDAQPKSGRLCCQGFR